MESKYHCEICGTRPDQLSHHNSHLQTQKHRENCDLFVKEMKIFSMAYKDVKPSKWYQSEHKDYIISKYIAETGKDTYTNETVHEWFKEVMFSGNKGKYDWDPKCFGGKPPDRCYEIENNCECTGLTPEFKNWVIQKILKYKETVRAKPSSKIVMKEDSSHKIRLSRYTNVKFNKIKDIRYGLVDLRYLYESTSPLNTVTSGDMEIYTDDAVRYSCLLFDRYGISSIYPMYEGVCGPVDIEEHPEEKKYNSFYFYKDVIVEHTSRIANVKNYGSIMTEKKKIWVNCYMGDFMDHLVDNTKADVIYEYMSNEDVRFFIKNSLAEIFEDKIRLLKNQIEETKESAFRGSWFVSLLRLNPGLKIVRDQTCDDFFLFDAAKYGCFFSRNGVCLMADKITEEECEIPAENRLTESQQEEYLDFLNKKNAEIEKMELNAENYKTEMLKIQNISLSSELMGSIVNICQYLFEYNEELFEYYKKNDSYTNINRAKERAERELIENLGYDDM